MKRSTNIDYIIGMTRDFVNGDLDALGFCLDFNHEFISRSEKMYRENAELTDAVNFYLFENGFDTVDSAYGSNEKQLRRVMKRQYKALAECMLEDFGLIAVPLK